MAKKSDNNDKKQPQFGIIKQYLKDLSFECPTPSLEEVKSESHIEIGIKLESSFVKDHAYEVSLILSAKATTGQKTIFISEVNYSGIFLAKDFPEEQLDMVLAIDAPQLLFPFARSVLMNSIYESGNSVPPLDPINFAALYMQAKTHKQKAPDEQKKIEKKLN